MHGEEGGENRKLSRHMWSVPSTTSTIVAGVNGSNCSSSSSFFKDGRKISVGDSALFKPAQDSPPFVGLIRCWTSEKESNLKLRVNWLYRPSEVKLPKGAALEAAPNEVFYSFHSDEIPAASLLHPCKVAFLPRGVELPTGVFSFVCRRVYDITNKCLWWLTDQDYINERQEEVDRLLHKTHIEMRASSEEQQGARSPKLVNGSAATSPLKHSPDSVQTSSSNFSSHRKGKKRERGDQSSNSIKRERSTRPDDRDSDQLRSDIMLNLEISKFMEKGGLVDSEAVGRLVRLMQPEKSEKKADLTGRSMLASIIAATDKHDCLNQFVQLRGLHVLNEWLQEIRKGKIGDSGNVKSSDKSVDDFLLVLLRALDKLPVNLNALQMCNIGKSVNHLRSHKNSEIQKKARSLVDTWKKRVEAEMNIHDTKSGSSQAVPWPGRSQHDSSHGGNRHPSGSEAAIRSSVTHHTSLKTVSLKPVSGDLNSKPASAHPGGARSTLSPSSTIDNNKDGHSRIKANGASSESQAVARDDKSSSSSQSHTNSQCSSDQAKNLAPSGREDTKSSTAGSRTKNKTVSSNSKHCKAANGPSSGDHRETATNRSSSMPRNSAVEKVSDNAIDASVQESNNHKLIVKISNRVRGPVQSITGGCMEDISCGNSGASSPALSGKHDVTDVSVRGNKHDSHKFPEVDGSSTSVHQRTIDSRRLPSVSNIACSPSRNEIKSSKVHDSSFSSMNALIESCAKFSEDNAFVSAGDDVGMNLLASVAAREISKSGIVSPALSPQRNSKMAVNSSSNHVGNQKQPCLEDVLQQGQSTNVVGTDNHLDVAGVPKVEGESSELCGMSKYLHHSVKGCLKSNGTLDEKIGTASPTVSAASTTGRSVGDIGTGNINLRAIIAKKESQNELPVASQGIVNSLEAEDKIKDSSLDNEFEKEAYSDSALRPANNDDDVKSNVSQGLQSNITLEQNSLAVAMQSDSITTNEKPVMVCSGKSQHLAAVNAAKIKFENTEDVALLDLASQAGNMISNKECDPSAILDKQGEPVVCCADVDPDRSCKDENSENTEAPAQRFGNSASQVSSSAVALPERELHSTAKSTKSTTAVEEKSKEKSGSITENVDLPSASGCPNVEKLGFDLNEGFSVDEGKDGEPLNFAGGPCPEIACSLSPLQIPVSSASCGLPASITVASAAKGPFVPAEDLRWNKQELGWKGSAATSAFRPAEPRKVMEVPLGPNKAPFSDTPACRPARSPLDIDLNVADEDFGQEFIVRNNPPCDNTNTASLHSSRGLDLDLNKVDEAPDLSHMGRYMTSNIQRFEIPTQYVKQSTSNLFSNGATSGKRDFDLNDGPATEEIPVEQLLSSQQNRGNFPFQPLLGPRINNSDTGNCYSWYPPGTSYSVSVTPSALPDREAFSNVGIGGGPQRVMGGPTSALSFNPDAYRGSLLSSSPALPFHQSPFQYPVLPFGTGFPLPTSALAGGSSGFMDPTAGGRISAIPSQLVGNAAAVSFQYPQAYVVSRSIADVGNNSVVESNHRWGKQGLDLNSGPGVPDVEGRDESLPIVSRQVSTISSQSLAGEQARMYSMGGHMKRKEPDGEWNLDKHNFKQSSWR